MVSFSTTGLLLHVALFPPGTTHDCAIGQAGPSIWSRLPPAIPTRVPMQRIGIGRPARVGLTKSSGERRVMDRRAFLGLVGGSILARPLAAAAQRPLEPHHSLSICGRQSEPTPGAGD